MPKVLSKIKSPATKNKTIEASKAKGISLQVVLFCTFKSINKADTPRINKIFVILLPTILPKARSAVPLKAPKRFTTSSGAEVPKATTVRPTTKGEIPNLTETEEAPLTSKSAPKIKTAKPTISKKIIKIIN